MSLLPIVPDFLIAVLAAWLGASVVMRTPRHYGSRIFGLLTLLTALWTVSRILWRLTGDAAVRRELMSAEAALGTLVPPALLHCVLAFTGGRPWRWPQRLAVYMGYGLGIVVGIANALDLDHPIAVRPPYRELAGIPGPELGWGWIGFRALVLGLAIWLAWRAWRGEGSTGVRRGQLTSVLAFVATGALGGVTMILLRQLGGPDWPGTTLIALSFGFAAYGIFAQRAFLAPDVARQSVYYAFGTAFLIAAYAAAVLALERLTRRALAIDLSPITLVALVLTIAFLDPVRERARALLGQGPERRDPAYRRLRRALGDELLTSQRPEAAIGPAMGHLCRALHIRCAAIVAADGHTIAAYGPEPPEGAAVAVTLPLRAGQREFGQFVLGPKRLNLPYGEADLDLLGEVASFIAASLLFAERQSAQAAALDALSRERAALQSQEEALAAALVEAQAPPADRRLRVYALGPLRVERDGKAIQRWGGAKAGTRQAETVFAFLFDRGERGVSKDEFLEVIWPDVDLERADHAFHRTLGGLRRMLEPDLKRGGEAMAITHHNDRYRLDPALVGWSDTAVFRERLAAARAAPDPAAVVAALEEARALYRADYLDDCPFYGDSEYVEERRTLWRGRCVDVLLALGERYEAQRDAAAAAASYREALLVSGGDCPHAKDGLERLGLPAEARERRSEQRQRSAP